MDSNIIKKARLISHLVQQHYEPGNQNKCKLQVYRKYVKPCYFISERTFWRYLEIANENTV